MTKASGWYFGLIAIVAGVFAVGYTPTYSRYFVSEDFFTLRVLDSGGLWSTLAAHLTGPWLGLEAVRFYRPVSTALLHAEYLLWRSEPAGYMYTHFAGHLLNVFLVYQIAKWLFRDDRIAACGVAAIFGVYPYHLNTISFVGAYAIWICTTFWLVGVILYQQSIERGSKLCWRYWGSAGMLTLALGSYEQAVIAPGVFACLDLVRNARDGRGIGWTETKRWVPLGAVLGVYMVVRLSALSAFVGGYSDFPSKLNALGVVELVRAVFAGLVRLAVPTGDPAVARWVVILAAAGLATVTVSEIKALRRDRQSVAWLFGLAWIALSQVPYLLTTVLPGNGRYWYATSIGLGICLVAVAQRLADRMRAAVSKEAFVSVSLAVVIVFYGALLQGYAADYAQAGRLSRLIQQRVVEFAAQSGTTLFVRGHSSFIARTDGTNVAQLYQWGLADAALPPFTSAAATVYSVAGLPAATLTPLLERSDVGRVVEWNPRSQDLQPVEAPVDRPGVIADVEVSGDRIRARRVPGLDYRVVFVAQGGSSLHPIPAAEGSTVTATLPGVWIRTMRALYFEPIYFWLEATGPQGESVAVSKAFEVAPPTPATVR